MRNALLRRALASIQNEITAAGPVIALGSAPATHVQLQDRFAAARSVFTQSPIASVQRRVDHIIHDLLAAVDSNLPMLNSISSLLFESSAAKRIRPSLCLLMSNALNPQLAPEPDTPITNVDIIAQISEMIHVASLLHDDVLDGAKTRRQRPTANATFGNKASILCGDFILARSSSLLASLGSCEAVSIMTKIISDLVSGEIMQMRPMNVGSIGDRINYYMSKSYHKTASLMSNSCKTIACIRGHSPEMQTAAEDYGKFLGLCFQITDDLLDIVSDCETLGKNARIDLASGVATAPVLFAAEQFPQLDKILERKFSNPGDVEETMELVFKSNGIDMTRELINSLAGIAVESLESFPESPHREALCILIQDVINRKS